jgi:hypothetical protein
VCRVPDWTTLDYSQCPSIGGRLTSGIFSEASVAMGGEDAGLIDDVPSFLPRTGCLFSAEPFPCETKP